MVRKAVLCDDLARGRGRGRRGKEKGNIYIERREVADK